MKTSLLIKLTTRTSKLQWIGWKIGIYQAKESTKLLKSNVMQQKLKLIWRRKGMLDYTLFSLPITSYYVSIIVEATIQYKRKEVRDYRL